jgi:hypothetical protein
LKAIRHRRTLGAEAEEAPVVIASLRKLSFCALAALLLLATGTGQAAPTRLAADEPEFDLWPASTVPGRTASTEADFYMPAGKEMAKVAFYLPTGYGGVLGRALGTKVGDVIAWDPDFLPSFGSMAVGDPATYSANTCAPGTHQAVWLLKLETSSDLPPTPILIDATSASETAFGAYKAQFCLPPSSSGTMKVHELDLHIGKLTNPAATGAYTWRAFVTPYKSNAPYDAGTFELRSTIPMPTVLTLHGRYDRTHKRAILTGRLTAASYDVTGVYIDLYAKRGDFFRYSATTRVTRRGTYSIKRRIKKTTRFRMWTATLEDCAPGSPAPGGCISDTLANIPSPVVKVVVPKR